MTTCDSDSITVVQKYEITETTEVVTWHETVKVRDSPLAVFTRIQITNISTF